MTLPKRHHEKTKELLLKVPVAEIAEWLLTEGYFPEQYVLPPCFQVGAVKLGETTYNQDLKDPTRRSILNISFPKTQFTSRVFGILHPWNYHDIVFYLTSEWKTIVDHLFPEGQKFFSYSFPIPVSSRNIGGLSNLRSGRMIYEWIAMAERDLIAEAYKYNLLVRTDISSFYNSIYTHSIGWALHGRQEAFEDKDFHLIGSKIDRLIQYANGGKTNGIPIGPVLSDLIAEILLAKVDSEASSRLAGYDFIGTRFKDDYRILCNSPTDAKAILKVLSDELNSYNLSINQNKTSIQKLPDGLYRDHDREYFPFSLKREENISFKLFEHSVVRVLDIHRRYPGTNILEKFVGELFTDSYELKIRFSASPNVQEKEILKTFSLLSLLNRESEKLLCQILSVIEALYTRFLRGAWFKKHIKEYVLHEIKSANERESAFSIVWLVFFGKYLGLGLENLETMISPSMHDNSYVKSVLKSEQHLFRDSQIPLFSRPKDVREGCLAKRFAVFNREKETDPVDENDLNSIFDEMGESLGRAMIPLN